MILNEDEAKALLSKYGVARPPSLLIGQDQDIEETIARGYLKFPLVLKICGNDIAHKTEIGGVVLNIRDGKELNKTVQEFRERFPENGILVEEQLDHELEFILGIKRDPNFGLVIMFGAGGRLAELYRDVVFRKLPLDARGAREMISAPRIGKVCGSFRNMDIDKEAFVEAVVGLSRLAIDLRDELIELDINPLVYRDGVLVALDAKMVLKEREEFPGPVLIGQPSG